MASSVTREDAEEFSKGLGQVQGGSFRLIKTAVDMGVPKALGVSTQEWVQEYIGGYVRMTLVDRREAVAELDAAGYSTREAAGVLGVSHATVADDVRNLTESAESGNEPVKNLTESPTPQRPVDAEQIRRQEEEDAKSRQARYMVDALMALDSLLFRPAAVILDDWRSASRFQEQGPFPERIWTPEGLRRLAGQVAALADEMEVRSGATV